ncbi:MAG: serine/threonine protein phosphatase [Clostridia bacterium]|nr:serine/threonine protein phosphatase [Clostridia bacterium]
MSWFKKKRHDGGFAVQTAPCDYSRHPFGDIGALSVVGSCEKQLYRTLRESIPIIDAAIYKIVRLVGGFRISCRNENTQRILEGFLKNVNVNGISKGIDSFIAEYLEQLLTYGTAVGEMVLGQDGNIAALYNSCLDDVEIECGNSPLDIRISAVNAFGEKTAVSYPELILCSVIMPEPGKIYGTSVLKGLPFVSDIFLKIMNALGTNWERVGNVRFAVTYKPTEADRSFTKERAMQIASEWSKAMKSREPKDFVSVGDVSIKAIGADNQIPDSAVPLRHILEQITAKLSIPPFLLGLSWSTTERMSSQQADMLTSELEYYRRILDGTVRKIGGTFLRLNGLDDDFEIVWDNINLQDEVELAKARLYNAQAEEIEIRNKKG